MNCF